MMTRCNEHFDMSGNPSDAPFLCDQCGEPYQEEKAFGVTGNDSVFFCSGECAADWDDNRIEEMYEFGDSRP